jgi:LPXTG-motif cell wall-anchored protein
VVNFRGRYNRVALKAVVKTQPGPGVTVTEVPDPVPGADEVLVRVEATSICGSDLAMYRWRPWVAARMATPRVVGHEFCGVVEQVGSRVETVAVGDFIAAETHVVDNTCRQCRLGEYHVCENVKLLGFDRDGCFAELCAIQTTTPAFYVSADAAPQCTVNCGGTQGTSTGGSPAPASAPAGSVLAASISQPNTGQAELFWGLLVGLVLLVSGGLVLVSSRQARF